MNGENAHLNVPMESKPTAFWIDRGIHGPNEVKQYCFEGLWILHLYLYTGRVVIDGVEFTFRPGYASLMPPGATSTTYFTDLSQHLFAHFSLPEAKQNLVSIPIMQDLGTEFPALRIAFEQALQYASSHPLRAEVRLWDILWQLAGKSLAPAADSPRSHPAVHRALQMIEHRLPEPLRVSDLAASLDLSHNHLTRLFHAATGMSVAAYIQSRRIERAQYLLIHSTLPIKTIAAEVGIRDLHHFNKVIRRGLGESPRKLRARK